MLSAGVRLVGFTTSDWKRALTLFRPRRPTSEERDPTRPTGGVVGVHDGGRLVKLVHTHVGRLRLDDLGGGGQGGGPARGEPLSAESLARAAHASWALLVERGALDRVMERFAERLRPMHDLTEQSVLLFEALRREMSGTGASGSGVRRPSVPPPSAGSFAGAPVELWPARLGAVPLPTRPMVDGVVESVCPVGRSMVLGVFEDGELWTCLAVRREATGIDLILGPEELRADMGLLSRDWRRDYRHLARCVEDQTNAPLSFGVFSEVSTLRRLEVDPAPGAWARAVALRDLLLSPVPPALALPLGLDATRGVLSVFRGVLERVDPADVVMSAVRGTTLGPALQHAFDRVREGVPKRDGFHPLEILRLLLSRER